jgi:hypothetical protein
MSRFVFRLRMRTYAPNDGGPCSASQFRTQWSQPNDVMSILSIVGGDVVQRALAQISGGIFTPVAFSFGWVAYSFNSLLLVIGAQKLMPESDFPCILINGRNGYVRQNRSWILGRVLRDFDYWKQDAIEDKTRRLLADAHQADVEAAIEAAGKTMNDAAVPIPPPRERAGLCVSVFHAASHPPPGVPTNDRLFYSGIFVAIVQLGIASIPLALSRQWSILVITAGGIILAVASGALPQWKAEKWQCRRGAKTVILTEGNGAQHAIVILGREGGLDLEDLAAAAAQKETLPSTRISAVILALLWTALLITVLGLKRDSWFLLAVGGIGMLQNVVVAGAPRRPESFGLHLEFDEVISDIKVMRALMKLEDKHPGVGASLVATFFPGKLRKDEESFWEQKAKELDEKKHARKQG